MKRCLAALFLCLMIIPAAQAEETSITADWLVGVWRFDGGGEVCGAGFRLDADGTCTFYLTDDYEHFPPERLIPSDINATWRYEDGMLMTITESGTSTYPLEVYPERSERNGCDTIHLEEGMSGGFYQRGEERHAVDLLDPIPVDVLYELEGFHPDYQLEAYAEMPGTPQGDLAFSLIRCEHGRMLHGFRKEGEVWVNFLDTAKAVPQKDHAEVRLSVRLEGGSYDNSLWFDPQRHDDVHPEGPILGVVTSNGEIIEEHVDFIIQADGIFLLSYGDEPNTLIDVLGDDLVFYNISFGYKGRTHYRFNRDIWAVDFYGLPREINDVRITGEEEPPLPGAVRPDIMDKENFLVKQDVKLREGKYPVYMGPGEEYGRAADGKASVSTNGWVQVFGEYDGWLLIHYAISAEQYRFGWITDDALAKDEIAAELPFTFGDFVSADVASPLMDDPLNSHTPLLTLPKWTSVEYLAQLGENYSYVRVEVEGKVWWGFVYSWPLGHG